MGWETDRCLRFACAAAGAVIVQEGTRASPDEAVIWAFDTANRGDA